MAKPDQFNFSSNLGGPDGVEESGTIRQVSGADTTGGDGIASGSEAGQAASAGTDPDTRAPKRRGRQPYPRDAAGNIIRPADAGTGAGNKAQKGKGEKLAVEFKPNNRAMVLNNIQGMHAMAAALTKQPVFLLAPHEAQALTDSLCNVLDYHRINITDATGPWGLYVALGLTAYTVYKPRLALLKRGGVQIEHPSAATTPEQQAFEAGLQGGMDFSGDIDPSTAGDPGGHTFN